MIFLQLTDPLPPVPGLDTEAQTALVLGVVTHKSDKKATFLSNIFYCIWPDVGVHVAASLHDAPALRHPLPLTVGVHMNPSAISHVNA